MTQQNLAKVMLGTILLLSMVFMVSAIDDEPETGVYSFVKINGGEINGELSHCTFEDCYLYEGESFVINGKTMSIIYLANNEIKLEIDGKTTDKLEISKEYQFDSLINFTIKGISEGGTNEISYIFLEFSKEYSSCDYGSERFLRTCKLYDYPNENIRIFINELNIEAMIDGKVKFSTNDYRYPEQKTYFNKYGPGESFEYVYSEDEKYLITINKVYQSGRDHIAEYVEFTIKEIIEEKPNTTDPFAPTIERVKIDCDKECKLYYGEYYQYNDEQIKVTLVYEDKVYIRINGEEDKAYKLNEEIKTNNWTLKIVEIQPESSWKDSYIVLKNNFVNTQEEPTTTTTKNVENKQTTSPTSQKTTNIETPKQAPEEVLEKTIWDKFIEWLNSLF